MNAYCRILRKEAKVSFVVVNVNYEVRFLWCMPHKGSKDMFLSFFLHFLNQWLRHHVTELAAIFVDKLQITLSNTKEDVHFATTILPVQIFPFMCFSSYHFSLI